MSEKTSPRKKVAKFFTILNMIYLFSAMCGLFGLIMSGYSLAGLAAILPFPFVIIDSIIILLTIHKTDAASDETSAKMRVFGIWAPFINLYAILLCNAAANSLGYIR
jgi:hypothetical protein